MTLSWRVPKPPAASNGFLRFRSCFKPAWVSLEKECHPYSSQESGNLKRFPGTPSNDVFSESPIFRVGIVARVGRNDCGSCASANRRRQQGHSPSNPLRRDQNADG